MSSQEYKAMSKNKVLEISTVRDRIGRLVKLISADMYEREEIVAVSLLAALCGQNTFLFGPPGTAKSLIARRISCAFDKPAYFECLMNRFSTPEEVFGPVSIKALKEDRYTRKTDAYLPKAHFAFLDEIWKSSPAILNTLLTLINERIFKNGELIDSVPLKALIAASNETPDINQGLEALYDRFIVRLMVQPIGELKHFDLLLNNKPTIADINAPEELLVKSEEWQTWLQKIHEVNLSSETLTIIHLVRDKLIALDESEAVYVSDRRWQRAALLMKASAFFNGREETNHSDALLLQHCLWTNEGNYAAVQKIVTDAVMEAGIDSGVCLAEIDREKESLEDEIHEELFYSCDIYETEEYHGKHFLDVTPNIPYWRQYHSGKRILIPKDQVKSTVRFSPVDQNGNEIRNVSCQFWGQGSCKLYIDGNRCIHDFTPRILFLKGSKKAKVNRRLIDGLLASILDLRKNLTAMLETTTDKSSTLEHEFDSIFIPNDKTGIPIIGISRQIEELSLRIKDCERLEALCQ
jgi:MoxR-like ATPase